MKCSGHCTDGRPCGRHAMKGTTVCYKHGGKSLIGPANPAWKDGTYSKLMAKVGLGEAYDRAHADKNLLSLRKQIAMMEARIESLMARLSETPGGLPVDDETREQVWKDLLESFEHRRKLTETEAKTAEKAFRVLTSQDMVGITTRLITIITRHVHDRAILQAIGQDIRELQVQSGGRR